MTLSSHFAAARSFVISILISSVAAIEPARAVEPDLVVCTPIATANELSAIRNNLAGVYCLAKDIDLAAITNFVPIGDGLDPFTGRLYGGNHVIRNLTINSSLDFVGLFGATENAIIQDLVLENVNVTVTGGLGGPLMGQLGVSSKVAHVSVSGLINGASDTSIGGLVGLIRPGAIMTRTSSAVSVIASDDSSAGGLVAVSTHGNVRFSYATGAVTVGNTSASFHYAGGLVGNNSGVIEESYATGPVTAGDNGGAQLDVGGLAGFNNAGGTVRQSYATGPVHGGASAFVGGLIGDQTSSTVTESYAAGKLSGGAGASLGGLIASGSNSTVTNAYWDASTTGDPTSAGNLGTPLTTAQLRAALPIGFGSSWWITPTYSYPFLNDQAFDFTSPLATSVAASKIFTFLPISQLDAAQYLGNPVHNNADKASLATVYTMIARAIGLTDDVTHLKDVKIDRYFWHDATQTATFSGPVTTHASIGAFTPVVASATLNDNNVVGELKANHLVILRGNYAKAGGGLGRHWLLATLFTSQPNGATVEVVADDPLIGEQVTIDPQTKTVTSPAGFPLSGFKIDGYQAVVFN